MNLPCTCQWSLIDTTIDPPHITAIDPNCPRHGDHVQYDSTDDVEKSFNEVYRVIRERKAVGGKGWPE